MRPVECIGSGLPGTLDVCKRRRLVAISKPKTPKQLPKELQEALDHGVLTQEQLQELIAFQAATLGLGYEEAVQRAYEDTLPRNTTGTDLRLLVSLLVA